MSKNKSEIQYNQAALEHLHEPVALDDALRVVSLKNWYFLVLFLFIMGAFVVWIFFGKIYLTVEGSGILFSVSGSAVTVQASEFGGVVKQIYVKPGTKVKKNQLLMSTDSDLLLQVELSKKYLNQLKEQQTSLAQRAITVVAELEKNQKEQVEKINASLVAAQEKLKQLETMLALKEQALKKGIIDLPNVTETRIEYYRLLQEIRQHEAELVSMKANIVELRDKWRDRQKEFELTVDKAEYDYQLAQKRWQQTSTIYSSINGVVAEIRVKEGDHLKSGEPLMSLVPENNELYALVFVPATKGKSIKVGMNALITPTIVNKLEFGSIKGHVESISLLPVTQENMMTLLKNQELLNFFHTQGSAPLISVKIALYRNKATPSGYQWTSSKGPNAQFTQGTVVESTIETKRKRPIDFLFNLSNRL